MNEQQIWLGVLFAVSAGLLIVVLVGLGVAMSLWAWFRSHQNGKLQWGPFGFELSAHRTGSSENTS